MGPLEGILDFCTLLWIIGGIFVIAMLATAFLDWLKSLRM